MTNIIYFLKNRKEVNAFYKFCLENGYCQDETFDWLQRTMYFKAYKNQ